MIPLDRVRTLNTNANVLSFPATAQITEFAFQPNNLHLRYSKQGVWPPVAFGEAAQEATLWVAAKFNAEWFAAGMERLRPNQVDKPEAPDPHGFIAAWVQGRDFGPFNSSTIAEGASIGVFVVAGNSRLASDFVVQERTLVVELPFPPVDLGATRWTEGAPAPVPTPVPQPIPLPTPVEPGPTKADLDAAKKEILNRIDRLERDLRGALKEYDPILKKLAASLGMR